MGINIGNITIDNLYIGSIHIDKVYLGEDLVFPIGDTGDCYLVGKDIKYKTPTYDYAYDIVEKKWYVKNSANVYEEYGKYADSIEPYRRGDKLYIMAKERSAASTKLINTGVYPAASGNTKIELDARFKYIAGNSYFGYNEAMAGSDSKDYRFIIYSASGTRYRWDNNASEIGDTISPNVDDSMVLEFGNNYIRGYIGDVDINKTGAVQTQVRNDIPIYLNLGSMSVRSFKIWSDDILVFDGRATEDGFVNFVNGYTFSPSFETELETVIGGTGTPTYDGKLAIVDGREYEFANGVWNDRGEISIVEDWVTAVADFDRSKAFSKVRFLPMTGSDTSVQGFFSEFPNINLNGKKYNEATTAATGWGTYHRFNPKYGGGVYTNDFNHSSTADVKMTNLPSVGDGWYELDLGTNVLYWGGHSGSFPFETVQMFTSDTHYPVEYEEKDAPIMRLVFATEEEFDNYSGCTFEGQRATVTDTGNKYVRIDGEWVLDESGDNTYLNITGDFAWTLPLGYTPGIDTKIEITTDLLPESEQMARGMHSILGTTTSGNDGILLRTLNRGNTLQYIFGGYNNGNVPCTIYGKHTFILEKSGLTYDGNHMDYPASVTSFDKGPLKLGNSWAGNCGALGKYGEIKISENGEYAKSYIPTLDDNSTPCYMDSVTGEYFYATGNPTIELGVWDE